MKRYSPKDIEPKWQKIWDKTEVYKANLISNKPKYISMSQFNYPSGAGIHIGHAMNFTISDVMARFKRQQGYESYHPVGWDAFGLPAENYAIKAGVSPQESMAKIIPSYHKQYRAMGWSNDWSKEIATHLPEYYKWTQWIFSEMYRSGLAYQDTRMQWWCMKCQTVLANEQVIDGKCWRHDGDDDPLAEKREVKQWFFRITDYADELLEATDALDWTESVKFAQKNWIGKSQGAEIIFEVEGSSDSVTVFTTRPDTLFGATFLVLAPEHELVREITTDEQRVEVEKYVKEAVKKDDIERQEGKVKTGVFTGSYAVNPVNNVKIPIWIADYVLMGYGTGAIMAVPAHDERDFEFAKKFEISIIRVIKNDATDDECTHDEGTMINSGSYDGKLSADVREEIVADLIKQGVARDKINYRMRDWSVSRQRYWGAPIPIVNCPKDGPVLLPDDQLPVVLPELEDFQPSGDGRSALARAKEWLKVKCPDCGGDAERETDTLDTYICSSWYMYRYFDPTNTDKIFDSEIVKKWEPIDFYNGADHATAHLLYARFIGHFFKDKGLVNEPEPFKQFLFNGKVTASDGTMFSKSKGNGVDPLDIIEQGYGADALRTYLMFASPLELWAKWDPQGVPGTYRFINRVWNLIQEFIVYPDKKNASNEDILRVIHPAIKKVTKDLDAQKYNTAIATLMQATNELYQLKANDGFKNAKSWQFALESLVMLLAPFAPFAAEELWHDLGNSDSIHRDHWPVWDEKFITGQTVRIAVQINGKVRGTIEISAKSEQTDVEAAVKSDSRTGPYLKNQNVKKIIYVPDKLISFVI